MIVYEMIHYGSSIALFATDEKERKKMEKERICFVLFFLGGGG